MEDRIIRLQAAVDELEDLIVDELKEVLGFLESGDVESATAKLHAMLKSVGGDDE